MCAAECGDYVVEDYPDHTYLSTYKFVPNQDHELERRIMENHKKHAYVTHLHFYVLFVSMIRYVFLNIFLPGTLMEPSCYCHSRSY
jgi:hypothetical protein